MSVPNQKLKACKVEYETKDRTNWKAVIIAYTMEDAVKYLMTNVVGFNKYISTQILGDIDAIETTAFKDYFVGDTNVVETVVKSDDDDGLLCPWCDKSFKNKVTLGNHIKKFHMEQ